MLEVVEKLALTHVAPAYLLGASLFGAYLQATLPEQIPAHAMTVYYVLTLGPLFVFAMWRVSSKVNYLWRRKLLTSHPLNL